MSTRPAALLKQKAGQIAPGFPADLTLADLDQPFVFDKNASASKARNTPYHEFVLRGQIKMTVCAGRVVFPW
jgi:dihydroorotase